jgi:mRNA-degrading endonuclease toxin of MazEF toxin-antitoxin module
VRRSGRSMLGEHVGQLTLNEMQSVDDALQLALDLG